MRRWSRVLVVAVLMGAATTVFVRPAAAATIAVPAGIDATGERDVSAELDEFFATVPAGSTIAFPEGGRYRVERGVRLTGLRDVAIEGHGATLFADDDGSAIEPPPGRFRLRWPRLREHVTVTDADGLTVRDLVIAGPNERGVFRSNLEGQAGFAIYRSRRVALEEVAVSQTHGDGVYIAGVSADIAVRRSAFTTIGRQGIAVVNATNIEIAANRLDGIARSVVDLEPASPRWSVVGVNIHDNDVGNFGNFLLAAGGAGPSVTDVWLERNRVSGGNGIAVYAGMPRWPRQGLHVIGNVSDAPGRPVPGSDRGGVLQIANIDGVEIVDNRQPIASDAVAVTLARVCNLTMHDNDFAGASRERQTIGECGAADPGGLRPDPTAAAPPTASAGASASGQPPASDGGTTNTAWIVTGAVTGAVGLLILGGRARRARPRSRV